MNTPQAHSWQPLPGDKPPEELFWLAVQYYLGELSPEQHQAFQARLEHDAAAQCALAEAVQLCLHVDAALAASPPVQPAPAAARSTSWWPAVLSAAAVVLLVVGVWRPGAEPLGRQTKPRPSAAAASTGEDAALAQAWVRLQLESPLEEAPPLAGEEAESEPLFLEAEEDEPGELPGLAVPQWMLVALDARGERPGEDMMTP